MSTSKNAHGSGSPRTERASGLDSSSHRTGRSSRQKRIKDERANIPKDLTIVALDPGGRTGWCVMQVNAVALLDPGAKILNNITHFASGEFGAGIMSGKGHYEEMLEEEQKQVDEIEDLLDAWEHSVIVREDFILRTSISAREVLSPVRLGSMIDREARHRNRAVWIQSASMAKTTATDERLKNWGLYKPGSDHARDAVRHAIVFARRAKDNRQMLVKSWPRLDRYFNS